MSNSTKQSTKHFGNCPICKQTNIDMELPTAPFCSTICKDKDLGNWALESYRIPSQPESLEEFEEIESLLVGDEVEDS